MFLYPASIKYLENHSINIDKLYEELCEDKIYWVKEKVRHLTKEEKEDEAKDFRVEGYKEDEIIKKVNRMRVVLDTSVVLVKKGEKPKSTDRIEYTKTIPYPFLISYIEQHIIRGKKWKLLYNNPVYDIEFNNVILNFNKKELYTIEEVITAFLCYLKVNNLLK